MRILAGAKIFAKSLHFFDFTLNHRSRSKLYVDSVLPESVLERIRMLKAQRCWAWRGEFNSLPEQPDTLEVFMYTFEGTPRIVQISNSGDIKFIYQLGSIQFYVC